MRHIVVWTESARDELARLWVNASDRSALAAAANRIDAQPRHDPDRKGTDVAEGLRALFEPPLKVLFEVRAPDRVVEVLRVRKT